MTIEFSRVNNNRIRIPAPVGLPSGTKALTICAFFNHFVTKSEDYIIAKATGTSFGNAYWTLHVTSTGDRLKFRLRTDNGVQSVTGSTGIAANKLYWCAGRYTGSQIEIWLSDVFSNDPTPFLDGSTGQSGDATNNITNSVTIGSIPSESRHWDGTIADVRIYTRALVENELTTIASTLGQDGIVDELYYWWPLNEDAEEKVAIGNKIIKDHSDSKKDGNAEDSPNWTDALPNNVKPFFR